MKHCPKCKAEYRDQYDLCIDCNIPLVEKKPTEEQMAKEQAEESRKPTFETLKKKAVSDQVQAEIIIWIVLAIVAAAFPEWSFSLMPTTFGALMSLSIPLVILRWSIEISFIIGAIRTIVQPQEQLKLWVSSCMPMEIQRAYIGMMAMLIFYLLFGPMLRIVVVLFLLRFVADFILVPKHHDYIISEYYAEGFVKQFCSRIFLLLYIAYFGIHQLLAWIEIWRSLQCVVEF